MALPTKPNPDAATAQHSQAAAAAAAVNMNQQPGKANAATSTCAGLNQPTNQPTPEPKTPMSCLSKSVLASTLRAKGQIGLPAADTQAAQRSTANDLHEDDKNPEQPSKQLGKQELLRTAFQRCVSSNTLTVLQGNCVQTPLRKVPYAEPDQPEILTLLQMDAQIMTKRPHYNCPCQQLQSTHQSHLKKAGASIEAADVLMTMSPSSSLQPAGPLKGIKASPADKNFPKPTKHHQVSGPQQQQSEQEMQPQHRGSSQPEMPKAGYIQPMQPSSTGNAAVPHHPPWNIATGSACGSEDCS